MLRTLRLKLTILYILIAVGLVGLLGAGTYALLNYYFQQSIDRALQYRMAIEFRNMNLSLPPELVQAEQLWQIVNPRPTPLANVSSNSDDGENDEDDQDSDNENKGARLNDRDREEQYDGDLSPIFVMPLTEKGVPAAVVSGMTLPSPLLDAGAAVTAAMENGSDLRNLELANGQNARVLTYRTGIAFPAVLQAGRMLDDQERVLRDYLAGLSILGACAVVLLGLLSWWLAGRSLDPAQRAWDQQQTFVSNASHELRTPLTFLRATADFALRNRPSAEQAEHLTSILSEVDYMNRLVDDLLLLSRLDAKRLQLAHEPIDISKLFTEISEQIRKLPEAQDINIETRPISASVFADPDRLRQVLLILLDNALKFTPQGGTIRIEADQRGRHIDLRVVDTGAGISPEHQSHLFERFYQVHPANADGDRSNGLGLSIAKALVEAQGGTIRLDSKLGQGTRVTISF